MGKARTVTFVAALLALAAIPAQAESVEARNAEFLWSLVGDIDPATPVDMHDGRALTLGEAIDEAAARAGGVDLAAMASGAAAGGSGRHAGDVWVIEVGNGDCSDLPLAPQPVSAPVHAQAAVYSGYVGEVSTSHGYFTLVTEWSTKTTTAYYNTGGFSAQGAISDLCFSLFGMHLAFPMVFGCVEVR